MSSDETPKIEPTLISIDAAPSITPPASETPDAAKAEAKVEHKSEQAPKADADIKAAEPAAASEPTLPPAPTLSSSPEPEARVEPKLKPRAEATVTRMPALHSAKTSGPTIDATPASKPRVARFALLAACIAIAASFGAVGGSLGVAKFGPMFAAAPPPPVHVAKDNVAEEVKSLKDTVAQLRGTTKSLSDNLAALKTSVNSSNNAQNAQIGKIAETLDRVEKAQAEQRKTAAAAAVTSATAPVHVASTTQATAAASDVTGSIKQQQQVPMVLGSPPQDLKPPVVQGWVLRRVYDGAALIEGRDGIIEAETGMVVPGLGRIDGIKRQDGRWVVVTARGLVVGR